MNRRELLGVAALAGAGAVLASCSTNRRPGTDAEVPSVAFEWEEATIPQLQAAMSAGKLSAVALTRAYLGRIAAIDKGGPCINSIIELNPDARASARALDDERESGKIRGPLHGIPVLIKDNIDTHDRMMTTAGSLALLGSTPAQDSFVARKLREAGAVILGKTNLSEWANIRSSRSTSGWSGRGGLTRNPYALDRNPSGSSSGSASAVSANCCAVAIGTETDGSIVSPSTACGIVGIKPTLGLISRSGIIPIAHSQDTAGPMARTVTDAAILLAALTGIDPRDAATESSRDKSRTDDARFLDPAGLRGARIGIARKFFGITPKTDSIMEAAIQTIKDLGATVIDPTDLPSHGKFGDPEFQVLLYEFKADLNAYLASLGPAAPVHNLQELIDFNNRNAEKEMPWFGQDTFIKAQEKGPLSEKAYTDALATCRRLSRDEGIDAIMNEHNLDAIVAPTGGPAGKTDLLYGDRDMGGCSTPAAVAGYPHITLPAGYVSGLPVGISFFGRAYSEPTLLKLAYSFEQATKARKAPRFLSSIESERVA